MAQPTSLTSPIIRAGNTTLQTVNSICYLGNIVAAEVTVDVEISNRHAKASASFGRLSKRLWKDHGIRLETKVAVHRAAILNVLMYGSETSTMYWRHITSSISSICALFDL
jgi:hypothetical protein